VFSSPLHLSPVVKHKQRMFLKDPLATCGFDRYLNERCSPFREPLPLPRTGLVRLFSLTLTRASASLIAPPLSSFGLFLLRSKLVSLAISETTNDLFPVLEPRSPRPEPLSPFLILFQGLLFPGEAGIRPNLPSPSPPQNTYEKCFSIPSHLPTLLKAAPRARTPLLSFVPLRYLSFFF